MNNVARRPGLSELIQQRIRYSNRERWFRLVLTRKSGAAANGFFDDYPRFYATSVTHPEPDRLNQRHRALIQWNSGIIEGQRVLDIASHDGRWSFAAYKTGATYVVGLEARAHLVEAARENVRHYGAPSEQVQFRNGDAFEELDRLQVGSFDTVFCFGFFYHTIDHMPLLRRIARLKPKHVIIDTLISLSPARIIEIKEEAVETESNGAIGEPASPERIVIGQPSKPALELMLRASGFRAPRYYDWLNAGITRWDDLEVYYLGKRVSLTAESCQ